MDVSLFFFLPLISGFIFVNGFLPLRYKSARTDTQRLYYHSAVWGSGFFVAGGAIHYCLEFWSPTYLSHVNDLYNNYLVPLLERPLSASAQPLSARAVAIRANIVLICIWAFTIGILTPLWNFFMRFLDATWVLLNGSNAKRSFLRKINRGAIIDDIELLLSDAVLNQTVVQVVLSSSKVYVGSVIESPNPSSQRESFRIQPLMSGYRDKDSGKVEYNTFYTEVFEILTAKDSTDQSLLMSLFQIAVPFDKVMTVSGFDFDVYNEFQRNGLVADKVASPETVVTGKLQIELV